jgi:predicted Rossmann fold nucleotide-binding protein DprA/Smf involved in DNA uptake
MKYQKTDPKRTVREWLQERLERNQDEMEQLQRRRDFLLELQRDLMPVFKPDTLTLQTALRIAGVEGMTARDLAEVTGINVGSVSAMLLKLRQKGRVTHDAGLKKHFAVPDDEIDPENMTRAELDAAIDAELLTKPTC